MSVCTMDGKGSGERVRVGLSLVGVVKGLLDGLDTCKVSLSFPLFLTGENGLKPGNGATASALRDFGIVAEVRDGDERVRGVEGF